MTNGAATTQVRWWVPGDWNGFFGLFTNVVLNVIVLTGLCLGVVQLPGDVVFGRILVRGEYGHDIVDELKPAPGEPVVDKPGKGAFYATDLDSMLHNREIRSLVVCGVTTEVCVNTSVREANDRGYDCLVLEDCVGSYFPEFQTAALNMIKAQGGIFGWVSESEKFLRALKGRP